MFPSTDPARYSTATSWCATYTQAVQTATTGFIPRFTSGCGFSPSRYSSACACIPTWFPSPATTTSTTATSTTTTPPACAPTPYEVWQNGDFECGWFPWRPLVTLGTTYALAGPAYSGSYAFQVTQNGPIDTVGLGQALLEQLIYITPGVHYTLTFQSYWSGYGGFIGVKINGNPVYTVDAGDRLGPGVWNTNSIQFTATTGQHLIEFEWIFGNSNVFASIDAVVLSPGT